MKKPLSLLLAAALALAVFSSCSGGQKPVSVAPASSAPAVSEKPVSKIPSDANLLTGLKRQAGEPVGQRPMAVMVNNIIGSMPQRGITEADLIYEMVTEGGITRLMTVFTDYKTVLDLGSVRSARDQHVQMMFPLEAIYMHVGGSTYAKAMLEQYKYNNRELDGQVQSGFLWKDTKRAMSEYSWFTNGKLLQSGIANYKVETQTKENRPVFKFVPYDQPKRTLTGGDASGMRVQFSQGYVSTFEYKNDKYYKSQFGAPHMDANNNQQLAFDNLLILFTDVQKYPDGILAKVDLRFGGVGYYLCGGKYEKVRWMKGMPEQPLRIVSMDGKENDIAINPGKSYIAMVGLSEFEQCKIYSGGQVVDGTFSKKATSGKEAD